MESDKKSENLMEPKINVELTYVFDIQFCSFRIEEKKWKLDDDI